MRVGLKMWGISKQNFKIPCNLIKKFQTFKNSFSHTLGVNYLSCKYLPQKVHQVSNPVMEKNTARKRKIKFYHYQWFSLGLPKGKFSMWCFLRVPHIRLYIRSILINRIAALISKEDVLHRV